MSLALTDSERDLLLDVLSDELGRLKSEIHRTDTWDFKEELKAREELLAGIIERLRSPGGSEAA